MSFHFHCVRCNALWQKRKSKIMSANWLYSAFSPGSSQCFISCCGYWSFRCAGEEKCFSRNFHFNIMTMEWLLSETCSDYCYSHYAYPSRRHPSPLCLFVGMQIIGLVIIRNIRNVFWDFLLLSHCDVSLPYMPTSCTSHCLVCEHVYAADVHISYHCIMFNFSFPGFHSIRFRFVFVGFSFDFFLSHSYSFCMANMQKFISIFFKEKSFSTNEIYFDLL